MRERAIIAALCFAGFCAFDVPPFDLTAMTTAQANFRQGWTACAARTDYKTLADSIDCVLAADRALVAAIRLRDTHSFDAFLAKVKTLSEAITAGTLAPAEAKNRFLALHNDFFDSLRIQYADYQSRMAQDYLRDGNRMPPPASDMGTMNGMGGM